MFARHGANVVLADIDEGGGKDVAEKVDEAGGQAVFVHADVTSARDVAGTIGISMGLAAYVAAKHGVIGLTRAAALEYATRGVRINALCPGVVRTAMLDDAIRRGILTEEEAGAATPVRRLADPAEIAQAAIWLCSDAASFVTGHAMACDGGLTAGIPTRPS